MWRHEIVSYRKLNKLVVKKSLSLVHIPIVNKNTILANKHVFCKKVLSIINSKSYYKWWPIIKTQYEIRMKLI